MKISFQTRIAVGFGVALLLLLLIMLAAIGNAFRFGAVFRQVDHAHAVLDKVDHLLTGVRDMQTGARDFVLTGSEDVLAPFFAGRTASQAALPELLQLTAVNPGQRQQLDALEPMLNQAGYLLDQQIAARRVARLGATGDPSAFLRSRQIVEQACAIIANVAAEERLQLRGRMQQARSAARISIAASTVGGLVAITFVLAAALMLRRDSRQRAQSQSALHQSQAMFQRLFDNAPDATIQVNQAGRIVRASKQAEALFGWTVPSLTGQPLAELLPKRFVARHGGHLAAYFSAPRTRPMGVGLELLGRRRDGSEFPVDIMLSPLDTDEGVQALAVIRDVTAQKATDEKIRRLNFDLQLQNARLEAANGELEAFSYSVSHDLRAPLRHIDGFASLLSKHAASGLDETGHRYIAVISDAARRMGRLIDDLLTFSRMNRTQLDAADVDQNLLVAGTIRESGFDRDGHVEWHIEPLPPVRADASMLRQVWFNLLDNAVKYSGRSAKPRIEVGSLPDPETPGGHVFFVRDNGVGFDMKYAPKLFGVFQRLHSEAEFEGTGIGLANVRRVVVRHGGRTWAESTPGAGATFYFSLPPPSAAPRSDV